MSPITRTAERVRQLSADDLGYGVERALTDHASNRPDEPLLAADNPLLLQVRRLMTAFGGVIFTGPPGTSKTWYAAKIATVLAGSQDRVRFVQFHPSYQYEDFMEGYVPRKDGDGFELKSKHFVQLCIEARKVPDHLYVLVIDELSRGDPGRVFGEALTYVERSKRGLTFQLASGRECVVPDNLLVLATMNPLDRGVDEVDAAFERRFAKIAMEPDRSILEEMLDANGVVDPIRRRLLAFFSRVNSQARNNPQAAIGHTFFSDVKDAISLRSVWDHQLRFLIEKAHRLDPAGRDEIARNWESIFVDLASRDAAASEQAEETSAVATKAGPSNGG